MELRPEQLASQGADTALAPVYLIAGPETLRVLEAADAIRARARASGIGEREVFDADGRDFDWNQLDASFNAPSLFSARRLVEVRLPSGKPGKDGAEVISQFCANPAPDVVLMITANSQQQLAVDLKQQGYQVLYKPVRPLQLKTLLRHLLERKVI